VDIITDGMPAPVKEMKALLGAVAAWILMIGAPLVYAETAFQSGYRHGVDDGKLDSIIYCANAAPGCTDPPDKTYIHQPGNGFDHHTTAFVDGYIKGWCLAHHGGGIDVNDDENPPTVASFDCDKGLKSAYPSPSDWPN